MIIKNYRYVQPSKTARRTINKIFDLINQQTNEDSSPVKKSGETKRKIVEVND